MSHNEICLSISLHSRRKSIVFYWLLLARMNHATRLRLVTQNHPHLIIRSLNNILLIGSSNKYLLLKITSII
jgi:hypothetical protein